MCLYLYYMSINKINALLYYTYNNFNEEMIIHIFIS